eukprot:UN09161
MDLSHNKLTGCIPKKLPSALQVLALQHNRLSGTIPPKLPQLERMDLSYNFLTGRIHKSSIPKTLKKLALSKIHSIQEMLFLQNSEILIFSERTFAWIPDLIPEFIKWLEDR